MKDTDYEDFSVMQVKPTEEHTIRIWKDARFDDSWHVGNEVYYEVRIAPARRAGCEKGDVT